MKRVKNRAASAMILALLLLAGLLVYIVRFLFEGGDWAAFAANRHVHTNGVLTTGRIYDRNGVLLFNGTNGRQYYAEDGTVRRATLHAVGDAAGNIGPGAQNAFADILIGYNPIKGTYTTSGKGNNLRLTIDSELNRAAYNALDGRKGTVGVYNYKTGEILCMVSNPSFDPADPPTIEDGDDRYEGVYLNRLLGSTFTPGSVFKVITTAAAIEHIPLLSSRSFVCTGSMQVGADKITCPRAHGTMDIDAAFAVSCNAAYAELALELGGSVLEQYAKRAGLLDHAEVDGIRTARGGFTVAPTGSANLAWSGIGQHNDLVNPLAMMTYMGAIANGGIPIRPRVIDKVSNDSLIPIGFYFGRAGDRMVESDTAATLKEMLRNNVVSGYGQSSYPGLALCAKSGTAEVGQGKQPHAWFTGFLDDEEHPYAFVVLIQNGGSGASVAGSVANKVLQTAVKG